MRKGEMLAIARRTLGPEWAAAHGKDKKDELADAMAAAFGRDGEAESLGLSAAGRAAALGWTPSGFRAFDPARPPEEAASNGNGDARKSEPAGPEVDNGDAEEARRNGGRRPPRRATPKAPAPQAKAAPAGRSPPPTTRSTGPSCSTRSPRRTTATGCPRTTTTTTPGPATAT